MQGTPLQSHKHCQPRAKFNLMQNLTQRWGKQLLCYKAYNQKHSCQLICSKSSTSKRTTLLQPRPCRGVTAPGQRRAGGSFRASPVPLERGAVSGGRTGDAGRARPPRAPHPASRVRLQLANPASRSGVEASALSPPQGRTRCSSPGRGSDIPFLGGGRCLF